MQLNNLFTNDQVSSRRIIYTPSAFARTNLLYLQEIGSLEALAPHISRRSGLSSYLFFVVTKGKGELVYGEKKHNLKAGDCVFIDCQEPYSQCSSADDLWSLKWVHFYGPYMDGIYGKYLERGGTCVISTREKSSMYEMLLDELFRLADSNAYTRDMHIFDKLSSLMTLLMEETCYNFKEYAEENASFKRDASVVKNYIDTHYTEHMTLETLASHFFISKHYLARIFKEQYGVTVNNYIQQVRITHAKHMLRFRDEAIEVIAGQCGIVDANYFSRTFKKVEGITPGEYRRMWKGR